MSERRLAQAVAELKERNRKQDADIIDMREAIRKRDAEIAALEHNLEVVRENHRSLELHCVNREALIQSLIALRNAQTNEIAALREAVRWIETGIGGHLNEWRNRIGARP